MDLSRSFITKVDLIRTDPYHYPNYMYVAEKDHFMDRRARSRQPNPKLARPLPIDAELRAAVPDEMVQTEVRINALGSKPSLVDPRLSHMFRMQVKLQDVNVAQVRNYNVDTSCVKLPLSLNMQAAQLEHLHRMSQVPSAASRWKSKLGFLGKSGMSKVQSSPELMRTPTERLRAINAAATNCSQASANSRRTSSAASLDPRLTH